jgi:hypothetical protein
MNKPILIGLLMISLQIFGQKIEITPFGGYFFGGILTVRNGDLNIKNGGNFGIILGTNIDRQLTVEFMFNRLDTRLTLKRYPTGITEDLFNLAVNYIHGGVLYNAQRGKIQPFASFSLGAVWFDPKTNKYQSEWRFSFSVGGGAKLFITPSIGIRLQARLLVPVYFAGGTIFCGTGGCGWGVSAGSYFAQGDLSAGLILAL